MKLGVIDCGTNTFNLIIVELFEKGKYTKLFNTRLAVRLGEDSINRGFISEIPFSRGIAALTTMKDHLEDFEVEKVLAFATSAIRDAANGEIFVEEVKKQTNIKIDVIDGNREAELIYFGIREAVSMSDAISLIMDIGGGSNEFVLANRDKILWKKSFKIGAARVIQKFKNSDPILPSEIENINSYLENELKELFEAAKLFPPKELIGSSGAFESLVEMIHGELDGEPLISEKKEYLISQKLYEDISKKVLSSTIEQRKNIRGLAPIRVDMIVVSCLMINFILRKLNISQVRVSTFSLKEGALFNFIQNQTK